MDLEMTITLAGPWRLHVHRSTRISSSRSLPTSRTTGRPQLKRCARRSMKICALLVPREHKVEHSNPLKSLTDEELAAMVELLKASLEAKAQSAKVIEGKAEVVPSPAAPKPAS